jgi:hypothetical protein
MKVGADLAACERALCWESGMFVATTITFQFAGYGQAPQFHEGEWEARKGCHIFHKIFKNAVDSFVWWGLYTGTTRAGRRWRLLNAP